MSIIIRGMEMPENCSVCPLSKLSPTGESLVCNATLFHVPWDERSEDCPLLPLPEKHGRLVDVDELQKVKFHPLPYTHITPSDVHAESYKRGWNDAIDAITEDAPTVVKAEEEEVCTKI